MGIPVRDPRWKLAAPKPKLFVELSASPNPDFEPDEPQGYVDIKPKKYPVKDLAHAREVCQFFIRRNNLGGGNWTGGTVTDERGKPVAHVSYNGRVWDSQGSGAREIKV